MSKFHKFAFGSWLYQFRLNVSLYLNILSEWIKMSIIDNNCNTVIIIVYCSLLKVYLQQIVHINYLACITKICSQSWAAKILLLSQGTLPYNIFDKVSFTSGKTVLNGIKRDQTKSKTSSSPHHPFQTRNISI